MCKSEIYPSGLSMYTLLIYIIEYYNYTPKGIMLGCCKSNSCKYFNKLICWNYF